MTNKQLKFNRNFFRDIQFWLGLAVFVIGVYGFVTGRVTSIYFWMDILMAILGIVTMVDDLILHRKAINS